MPLTTVRLALCPLTGMLRWAIHPHPNPDVGLLPTHGGVRPQRQGLEVQHEIARTNARAAVSTIADAGLIARADDGGTPIRWEYPRGL